MRYQVVRTRFHTPDGRDGSPYDASTEPTAVITNHRTHHGAERSREILRRGTDCTCGCYVVVEVTR